MSRPVVTQQPIPRIARWLCLTTKTSDMATMVSFIVYNKPLHRTPLRIESWLLLFLVFFFSISGSSQAQQVWEWTPYRVQAYLAISPSLTLSTDPADLSHQIGRQVDSWVGAPWVFSISPATTPLRRKMLEGFDSITMQDFPETGEDLDKVMLICVDEEETQLVVRVCEVDMRTHIFNRVVSQKAAVPTKLVDTVFRGLCRAFAPLAKVEKVEDSEVRLRLRAAALAMENSALATVDPGKLFVPVVRYDDRGGNPRRIAVVPWTALVVEQKLESELVCRMETGMRTPLSSRRRGRFEQLAIALDLPAKPTRLRLVSRTDPEEHLPDYHVYEKFPDRQTLELLGTTDVHGEIVLEASPKHPLRILLIKHADQLLARLPVISGLDLPDPIFSVQEAEETRNEADAISPKASPAAVGRSSSEMIGPLDAPIMKDNALLQAKGALLGLQEELIDQMAFREILLARGRRLIGTGEVAELEEVKRELRRLKDRDRYLLEIDQLKNRFRSEDPMIRYRIDRLFENTRKLVIRFLEPLPADPFRQTEKESVSPESELDEPEQEPQEGETSENE
jgi:hypothetical protein